MDRTLLKSRSSVVLEIVQHSVMQSFRAFIGISPAKLGANTSFHFTDAGMWNPCQGTEFGRKIARCLIGCRCVYLKELISYNILMNFWHIPLIFSVTILKLAMSFRENKWFYPKAAFEKIQILKVTSESAYNFCLEMIIEDFPLLFTEWKFSLDSTGRVRSV